MEGWHYYYFFTTIIAIVIPVVLLMKVRRWSTSLLFFPIFYIIYSFVGPLPLIIGENFDPISRSYLVWDKMFYVSDTREIYIAHTYFFIFYIMWFVGFFKANPFKDKTLRKTININTPYLSMTFLAVFPLVFFIPLLFVIYSNFGFNFFAVYGTGMKILHGKYGTLTKTLISLSCSSIICFVSVVFIYLKKKETFRTGYLILVFIYIFAYFSFSFMIGDRSQLFILLISILVLWHYIYKNINISAKLLLYIILLMVSFSFIESFRGKQSELLFLGDFSSISFVGVLLHPFVSVESFAPYAAMPFLIMDDTPLLYGKSILAFFLAFIPRFLAPFRTTSAYTYTMYAEYAGLTNSPQGFAFHNVADWYWNFSILGVVFGGFLIGYLMGRLERKALSSSNVFWLIGFSTVLGHIPISLRSTIEGYRAILYEFWLIPFFLFILFRNFKVKVFFK